MHDQLGEGACWSRRDWAFYWVDILAPALNRLPPNDGALFEVDAGATGLATHGFFG